MHWYLLMAAIGLEVCGTVSMKLSNGLEKLVPSLLVYAFYIGSFYCLAAAIKTIDVGVAYAIWAGTGTALIAIVGVAYFREPISITKVACIVLVIIGVVGLNVSSSPHEVTSAASSRQP